MTASSASFLATRGGRLTLLLLCAVPAAALTGGFRRALLTCAIFLVAATVIALRATNTRGEPGAHPDHLSASQDRIPAPELTD